MNPVDAKNQTDVKFLGDTIATIDKKNRADLVYSVFTLGLMKFGFVINICSYLVGGRKFFNELFNRNPEIIDSWVTGIANHVINGKDKFDKQSVGGWSQQEIDTLVKIGNEMEWW